MPISGHRLRLLLVGSAAFSLCLMLTPALQGDIFTDCVGKPYGTPGCPTQATSSSKSSAPASCGNGVVEDVYGEECDRGRFNGQSDCSAECLELFCGDGIITAPRGEECEPQTEEIYVRDPVSGELTTEVYFKDTGGLCGSYCAPPTCSGGTCTGGCQWKFMYMCTSSSSLSSVPTVAIPVTAPSTAIEQSSSAVTFVSSSSSLAPVIFLPMPSSSEAAVQASSSSQASIMIFTPSSPCGNGTIDLGEECDDGFANSNSRANACRMTCRLPSCGDRVTDAGEECDDGNKSNVDACTTTCQASRCGDGYLQKGEECDDRNRIDGDSCSNDCQLPHCGDGIIQKGEECDDGTRNSNTRSNSCRSNCQMPTCGDGIVDSSEDCDDGNRNNEDACTNSCTISRCGDGFVQRAEECDDGSGNSDVRPNACRMDCRRPFCGDHVIDPGEDCDGGADCNKCQFRSGSVRTPVTATQSSSSSAAATVSSSSRSSSVAVVRKTNPRPTTTKTTLKPAAPVKPAVTEAAQTSNRMVTPLMVGGFGGLTLILVAYLRRRATRGLSLAAKAKSIDDIPLDQLEMPWHKW